MPNTARAFLKPDFSSSHDPFLLKDAEKAADRIISAIKNNERIVVYSDYDTDGIPAGAMFHDFFKQHRLSELLQLYPASP